MKRVSIMNRSVMFMIFLKSKNIPVLPRIINYINRIIFSCDIPSSVKIHKGTIFAHSGLGVVIHSKAIIGENCKIYQGVTIGGRGERGTPVIGNNVFIGANATIIGNVKIGDDSIIGANSLVIHDVKTESVVAGNPAKEIKY
ncbi:serine acetyltransferase [Virgibacillus halodenitrificans]|uniref:serine O-acetyltransferase n=1 Tax=Virgibacillus halodenitrificans TaxID=1482 RepID=UPI001FB26502|nr:DapH/DapD/GlmU-related protein [Virgibacillus halodenitrificans]MCJ0929719.1 serine acetyltransferase [Virgibacillus halodenitrificans]